MPQMLNKCYWCVVPHCKHAADTDSREKQVSVSKNVPPLVQKADIIPLLLGRPRRLHIAKPIASIGLCSSGWICLLIRWTFVKDELLEPRGDVG